MSAIIADRATVERGKAPPSFTITTERTWCRVEVATDPALFNASLGSRRTPTNWAQSTGPISVERGRAQFTLDPGSWEQMRSAPFLYYRATCFDLVPGAPPLGIQIVADQTTTDVDFRNAPSIQIRPVGLQPKPLNRWISGALRPLHVEGNRLMNDIGDVVVLRGINRSGMEYTERGSKGGHFATARLNAGITLANVRQMVIEWGANVLRVPLNQEWVLTRDDYLNDLDRIIEMAAAFGAYTILDLQWFDDHRAFGWWNSRRDPKIDANRVPPLPEANSVRMWQLLADRYRRQTAVLYDIFNEPHRPVVDNKDPLNNDTEFIALPVRTDTEWAEQWHAWVRRIEHAIHTRHGDAVLLVGGWDWSLDLTRAPVLGSTGAPLPNVVYSAHVYRLDRSSTRTDTIDKIKALTGGDLLRAKHPVFFGEWGGDATQDKQGVAQPPPWDSEILTWGNDLEQYLRSGHRFTDGLWRGIAGWTAWSWLDWPPLASAAGTPAGIAAPTEFGELVRGALRTSADAPSTEFDAQMARGHRNRYTVSAGPAVIDELFVVYGHDFVPGMLLRFSQGANVQAIAPQVTLPHLLLVTTLPNTIPAGAVNLSVIDPRPGGRISEPLAVNVGAAGTGADLVVINEGAAKARPFTIAVLGNPRFLPAGATSSNPDPIQTNAGAFRRNVGLVVAGLFGLMERALHPYARDIRVVARLTPPAAGWSQYICFEGSDGANDIDQSRARAYLINLGIDADVAMFLAVSRTTVPVSYYGHDAAKERRTFSYDGSAHEMSRSASTPGVSGFRVPIQFPAHVPHEFMHAIADDVHGGIADLYHDRQNILVFNVNKKFRASPGDRIPAQFADLDGRAYVSDFKRDGLGYPKSWRSYHPSLIDPAHVNLMDDFAATHARGDAVVARLDRLTLRYVRDRVEWKLGR